MSTVNKKENQYLNTFVTTWLLHTHTLHQTKANYVNQKKKHQMLRKMKNKTKIRVTNEEIFFSFSI